MQHIDENTYIGETLVTCAEYQLFIDEMREQEYSSREKYYQPDHWKSLRFHEGQAREPILGVRHSDADRFCEWLTKRETSKWRYRLPTQKEAKRFPLTIPWKNPIGYWIDGKYQFEWAGRVPEDARFIFEDFVHAAKHVKEFSQDQDYDRAQIAAKDFKLYRSIDRALARVAARSLDINRDIELDNDLNIDVGYDLDLDFDFAMARDRDIEVGRTRGRTSTTELDRDLAINLGWRLWSIRSRARALRRPFNLDLILDIYMDVFTLRSRIEGRSPAFEGIRLVGERIR